MTPVMKKVIKYMGLFPIVAVLFACTSEPTYSDLEVAATVEAAVETHLEALTPEAPGYQPTKVSITIIDQPTSGGMDFVLPPIPTPESMYGYEPLSPVCIKRPYFPRPADLFPNNNVEVMADLFKKWISTSCRSTTGRLAAERAPSGVFVNIWFNITNVTDSPISNISIEDFLLHEKSGTKHSIDEALYVHAVNISDHPHLGDQDCSTKEKQDWISEMAEDRAGTSFMRYVMMPTIEGRREHNPPDSTRIVMTEDEIYKIFEITLSQIYEDCRPSIATLQREDSNFYETCTACIDGTITIEPGNTQAGLFLIFDVPTTGRSREFGLSFRNQEPTWFDPATRNN